MLSNVGTISAMANIGSSLKKFSNYEVYYFDTLGEFSKLNIDKNFYLSFIKVNKFFPNTGKIAKFIIFFFSLLSIPVLIYQVAKRKPKYIITGLVGFIPIVLKIFFPDLKIINSIQGYPKFNYLRKKLWKFFYTKSDHIITMTNKTKNLINKEIGIDRNKISVIQNPVISPKIRKLSKEKIGDLEKSIFQKDVYCAIGRLTYQKNFLELLCFVKYLNLKNYNFNLIIIGEGEDKKKLKKFIKVNNLNNCFILGYKENPYPYLLRSKLYISTSLWEEPGHTLLEAGYLNVPILSSNCPNGPDEIIKDNFNGLKYKLGDFDTFKERIEYFNSLSKNNKKNLCYNMKIIVADYTKFRFSKKFLKLFA